MAWLDVVSCYSGGCHVNLWKTSCASIPFWAKSAHGRCCTSTWEDVLKKNGLITDDAIRITESRAVLPKLWDNQPWKNSRRGSLSQTKGTCSQFSLCHGISQLRSVGRGCNLLLWEVVRSLLVLDDYNMRKRCREHVYRLAIRRLCINVDENKGID